LIALGAALLGLAVFLIVRGGRGRGGEKAVASASLAAEAVSSPGAPPGTYPAALATRLDEPLNRWLWLAKSLRAIPHLILLAILWLAFVVLTVVAWFAVVISGRYPRGIFDFNLGGVALDVAGLVLRLRRPRHRSLSAVLTRRGAGPSGDAGRR
jgi:hypothetical protein